MITFDIYLEESWEGALTIPSYAVLTDISDDDMKHATEIYEQLAAEKAHLEELV